MWGIFFWSIFLYAVYLLFANKLHIGEIIAGIASSALTVLSLRLLKSEKRPFQINGKWLIPFFTSVPVNTFKDTVRIILALFKNILTAKSMEGSFAGIPFDKGGTDRFAAARRSITVIGVSFSPNTIVTELYEDHLTVHYLLIPPKKERDKKDRGMPI